MDDNLFDHAAGGENKTEMHVNDYGATRDSAVVVEESDRTVLLTDDETVIIPKETKIDLPPKNRARKVYAGMWGQTELITVGLGLLAILTTVLLFVFLVIPAQKEYEANRARRDQLAGQWEEKNRRYGTASTTQERVARLVTSVQDFETRLPDETVGRTALYQRLNGLIAAYGLTNTTGPDYAPLEILDQTRNQQSPDEKGRSRFVSIYPGVYVTMTVDGSYQNLRRFIREIESSEQFVVVAAVELEPSENKEKHPSNQPPPQQAQQANQPPTAVNFPQQNVERYRQPDQSFDPQYQPAQQPPAEKIDRGKVRGETVTLRLELAAYFRRAGNVPTAASAAQ